MKPVVILATVVMTILGFLGAHYYQQKDSETAKQRAGFSYFCAFVLGMAPLLYVVGEMIHSDRLISNGMNILMCVFGIALASMLISDLKDDEDKSNYSAHEGAAYVVLIVMCLLFLFTVGRMFTGDKLARFDKYAFGSELDYPHMFGFGRRRRH